MSDPFIAEVKIFAGNFAPRGFAFCNGQLLQIAQHTALFSLVGTTYGGNGRTDFALPDLTGRAAMQPRSGPGLSPRTLGEKLGINQTTLTKDHLPAHTHQLRASKEEADEEGQKDPTDAVTGKVSNTARLYGSPAELVTMDAKALPEVGGNGPHNNMMPYLGLNFIIALIGTYPPRN
jgi:microcystin-dependent protein